MHVMKETIVCIGAHSDDQVFGPGGTLAKYAKEGKHVVTMILSYGELSHPHFKEDVIVKTRVKESEDADKVIGGKKVIFYGLKEGKFNEDAKKRKIFGKIVKDLQKLKPTMILTHAVDDPHPDHRATVRLVNDLYKSAKLTCPVYMFDVWTPFSIKKRNKPKLIIDISTTFSKKIDALKCFRSQLGFWGILNYIPYTRMLIKNFLDGLSYGHRFAEVFYKLK